MYAGFLRQREIAKKEWYRVHHQTPPNLGRPPPPKREPLEIDTKTYTMTYFVDHYDPEEEDKKEIQENSSSKNRQQKNDLSLWEGSGAGIEPFEFQKSLSTLREDKIMTSAKIIKNNCKNGNDKDSLKFYTHVSVPPAEYPPVNRLNRCFTPYENDLMSFDAFETMRKELKNRSEHIACEMQRVDDEWNRPPKKNWFMLKKKDFTVEHCRFMELNRRRAMKEALRKRRNRSPSSHNDDYDPRRSYNHEMKKRKNLQAQQNVNMRSSYL